MAQFAHNHHMKIFSNGTKDKWPGPCKLTDSFTAFVYFVEFSFCFLSITIFRTVHLVYQHLICVGYLFRSSIVCCFSIFDCFIHLTAELCIIYKSIYRVSFFSDSNIIRQIVDQVLVLRM